MKTFKEYFNKTKAKPTLEDEAKKYKTADGFVESQVTSGVDKNLLSDMKSNIEYLKNNPLIARVNIDDQLGRTDEELLSMGRLSREAKDRIRDIVDIIVVEPKLKFLIDDDIKRLLKIQGYRDEVFTPNADLKSQLTDIWNNVHRNNI